MASWKTKGYVSDSEDEEEVNEVFVLHSTNKQQAIAEDPAATIEQVGGAADNPLPRFRETKASPSVSGCLECRSQHGEFSEIELPSAPAEPTSSPLTTAEKLEESISRGLSLVREALARSPSLQAQAGDADDSPLSTPLSTPPDSPALVPLPAEPAFETERLPAAHSGQPILNLSEQIVESAAPTRTFRQRNAIQQHPYSLEWAVYLKHCNERGIRPVHMPKAASPTAARRAVESQDTQFDESSQDQDSLNQASMDLDDVDRIDGTTSHDLSSGSNQIIGMDVGGDLPDLETLLSKGPRHIWSTKEKHSKTSATIRPLSVEDQQIYEMLSDDGSDTPLRPKPSRFSAKTQQESFPSPPRSMSVDTSEVQPAYTHDTPSSSPAALPTPILSSELRPRKRPVVEDDTQSGPENAPTQTLSSSSSSEEAESSDLEPDNPVNVRLMQKRAKGVLPASWWTVDRAQKMLDPNKKDNERTFTSSRKEVGVAQRKITSSSSRVQIHPTNSAWFGDLVSDDDNADVASTESPSEPHHADLEGVVSRSRVHLIDPEATEIVDDDGIDPMLSTRSRTEKGRPPKQTNLRGFVQEQQKPRAQASSAYLVRRNSIEQRRSRKKAKQRAPFDAIHVLDAPDLQGIEPGQRPPFLRLAARQARAQRKAPGISASRKFFQLEDEEETFDILDGLTPRKETKRTKKHALSDIEGRRDTNQASNRTSIIKNSVPRASSARQNPNTSPGAPRLAGPTTSLAQVQHRQDLGKVIQCGMPETNDYVLRLTRLRSLLSLTNRSGRGQFAVQVAAVRDAQLEVLRHDDRGLNRRNSPRPRLWKAASVLQERSPNIQSPDLNSDKAILRRKDPKTTRKQPPVFRPKFRQSRLAPSSPKSHTLEILDGQSGPKVRVLLEKEFAEHQAAWFQASKSGIMAANQKTQQHFQVFLDVLRSYLPGALQDAEDAREARELRSFLHRLIPNRGQIGAQGQIGDKVFEVLQYDILVARNVFDLHTTLLNLAPGCAPRPRVLEMKVNFSDAHHEICSVALDAWASIYKCHHQDAFIVEGLAGWMFSILSQLVTRWKAAEIDARTDAIRSMRRIDEQLIRKVIEFNRNQACELLAQALAALRLGITDATGLIEANALLDPVRYQEFLSIVTQIPEMNDLVIERVLSLPTAYIEQHWQLQHSLVIAPLLSSVRQALTTLTSTRRLCSSDLQHSMARVYFTIAKAAVTQRQRSWDDFFEPRSSYSLAMFVAESHLDSMKTFFFHCLLSHEPSHYELELRVPVLSHWLRALLQCQSDNVACCLLTASLFKHEKDSLAMSSLAALFQSPDSAVSIIFLQDRLPEIRHAVVMHTIQYLHGQENNTEADWLVGGLEEVDAVRLLRIIFSTMKEVWVSLAEQPEEQDIYTVLVHAALNQYERYPRTDFIIDQWFFNPTMFPQRRQQTLAKLFTLQFDTEEEFLKKAVEQFEHEVIHAVRYERLKSIEDELKNVLLPTDADMVTGTVELADVLLRHASFVEQVFLPIIDRADPSQADVQTMLLKVLVHVLENLECRIDALAQATIQPVIKAIIAVISSISRNHVTAADQNCQLAYTLTRLTFEWAATTMSDLPRCFISDIGSICDSAAETRGEEALLLLEAVMHMA